MSFSAVLSGNFYHLRNSLGSSCSYKLLKFQSGFAPENLIDARAWNLRFFTAKAEWKSQKSQTKKSCNINLNLHDGLVKSCGLRFQSGFTTGEVLHAKASNHRNLATKAEGENQRSKSEKPCNTNLNLQDGQVTSCNARSLNNPMPHELKDAQCYNLQHERKALDWPAVVIVFDIETTGLSYKYERIIEIAFRDLSGGRNSTFQTLVNPGKNVPNESVHKISSHMVNRPDVPRFAEMLPFLLQFIRSRQKEGKQILLVAHNGRGFDVPFLISEFQRCGVGIPDHWQFVDTLVLARENRNQLVNPDGTKPATMQLAELGRFYEIPLIGPAHRAMQDVNTLSHVLERMTQQLKLTIPQLLDRGFRASDLTKAPPRKKAITKAAPRKKAITKAAPRKKTISSDSKE